MIVNTTFHLEPNVEHNVLQWIGRAYVPSAAKAGADQTMVLKILSAETPAYAVQAHFAEADQAEAWNQGVAASLRAILAERWGENALTFVSLLEEISIDA